MPRGTRRHLEMPRAKENPKGRKKKEEAARDKWNDRQRLRMAELYAVICLIMSLSD